MPYEGLGLLAAQGKRRAIAVEELKESLRRGSTDFLTHYVYAKEKFELTAAAQGRYGRLTNNAAAEIRGELEKSLALMPDFAAAHELLGFFEMVQGDNLAAAERQLQQAIRLEPENPSYLLSLAQAQIRGQNFVAARQTLEPLLLPNADSKLHAAAQKLIHQ